MPSFLCVACAVMLGTGATSAPPDTLHIEGCEDHSPRLAVDAAGRPVAVWIASLPDTSACGRYERLALSRRGEGAAWEHEILDEMGNYYTPGICYADDGARWVSWAQHDGNDSQIFCQRDQDLKSVRFELGECEQPDLEPSICPFGPHGILCAWQGWRDDNYEILMAVVEPGGPGFPQIISSNGLSDREPCVVRGGGRAWIVWSAYQGEPYNLVLRTWDGEQLSPPKQITTSYRARNFHPHVAWDARSELLWYGFTWINRGWSGFNNNEWPGLWDAGSPRLRATDGERILLPTGLDSHERFPLITMEQVGYERYLYGSNPMQDRYGSGVTLAVTPTGRVWCFYKAVGSLTDCGQPNKYWGCVGINYSGDAWSEPAVIFAPRSTLGWEPPAVAASSDSLWVAWTADRRDPGIVSTGLNCFGHDLDVLVCGLPLDGRAIEPAVLVPAGPVVKPVFAPAEEREPFTIEVNGQTRQLLWGDNHRHSFDVSWDGVGDPLYKSTIFYSLDWLGHDYIAPSDHAERFSRAIWTWVWKWSLIYDVPGRFRVFPCYERSMRGGAGGDQNVLYRDPDQFSEASAAYPHVSSWHTMYQAQAGLDVLSVPHTTAECGAVADWAHLAGGNADSLPAPLRLVEVYQSARQSFEYLGCPLQFVGCTCGADEGWVGVALAMGMRIGLLAASDHTIRAGFTGVYAEDSSRDAIYTGLRARHCFGTSRSAKMNVDFRVAGTLMGGERRVAEAPEIYVRVEARDPLVLLEINKDGVPDWFVASAASTDTVFTLVDPEPPLFGTSSYYYLRVATAAGDMAWTSPVWLDFDETAAAREPPDTRLVLRVPGNPSNGRVTFAISGLADRGGCLRIYDVAGRLVRRLDITGSAPSDLVWDGRDRAGRLAASGVYLAVLQSGHRRAYGRVVLVR